MSYPGAERLGAGLFGGKALGVGGGAPGPRVSLAPLRLGKAAPGKALAETRQRLFNAADIAKVSGDIVAGAFGTLVLLLPGWVLVAVYNRGTPSGKSPTAPTLVSGAAFGGVLIHLLFAWWTIPLLEAIIKDGPTAHAGQIVGWVAVVVVVAPALLGAAFGKFSDWADHQTNATFRAFLYRLGVSATVRTPDAWPIAFRTQTSGKFVRVTVKGPPLSTILGRYGTRSAASSDSSRHDLFLQEEWLADASGRFWQKIPGSTGVWLDGKQIQSVEFFDGT